MDETILEATRESSLDKIRKCRRKIGWLLLLYFVVMLALVMTGGGNMAYLMASARGGASLWGKVLYVALPFFLWIYSQKAFNPGGILRAYAFLEGLQLVLLMTGMWMARIFVYDSPLTSPQKASLILVLAFGGGACALILLLMVSHNARKLILLQSNKGMGEDVEQFGMVCLILFCYAAPSLKF